MSTFNRDTNSHALSAAYYSGFFDGKKAAQAQAPAVQDGAAPSPAQVTTDQIGADVRLALQDALVALSFCGKSAQARALNANAARRIKFVLEQS